VKKSAVNNERASERFGEWARIGVRGAEVDGEKTIHRNLKITKYL